MIYLQNFTGAIYKDLWGQLLESFLSWNLLGYESVGQMGAEKHREHIRSKWPETLSGRCTKVEVFAGPSVDSVVWCCLAENQHILEK